MYGVQSVDCMESDCTEYVKCGVRGACGVWSVECVECGMRSMECRECGVYGVGVSGVS